MERTVEVHDSVCSDYSLSYRFKTGWNPESTLMEQLDSKMEMDLRLGYTSRGPHRAELELLADQSVAEKKLSRGQQKLLVLCLNLALMDVVVQTSHTAPIFLVDDLAAELDADNRARMIFELESRAGQVFLTKIEKNALVPVKSGAKTFHVEHGVLQQP